ncbi:MAG: 50S ribosomal protein L3 [Vampirovibrionia bacterium]
MTKGILGKKLGMTQVFTKEGKAIPVTIVQAGPCVVLQKKDIENDGYESIQLGFEDKKTFRASKPELGHIKKADTAPKRFVKEIRGTSLDYEVGQQLKADIFADGEIVDVVGISKGKGFAGSIKRHNQACGPMAHGSRYHRRPGSMGPVAPNRVMKGKLLPGRMGFERVTIQNLEVVKVDAERDILFIKGSVPGVRNSYVIVKEAVKNPNK